MSKIHPYANIGFTTSIDIPDDDFKHRLGQSEIFLS